MVTFLSADQIGDNDCPDTFMHRIDASRDFQVPIQLSENLDFLRSVGYL